MCIEKSNPDIEELFRPRFLGFTLVTLSEEEGD